MSASSVHWSGVGNVRVSHRVEYNEGVGLLSAREGVGGRGLLYTWLGHSHLNQAETAVPLVFTELEGRLVAASNSQKSLHTSGSTPDRVGNPTHCRSRSDSVPRNYILQLTKLSRYELRAARPHGRVALSDLQRPCYCYCC
jgi:hypothetical protein